MTIEENGDVDIEHAQVLHVSLILACGVFLSLLVIEGWNGRRVGDHPKNIETCDTLTLV